MLVPYSQETEHIYEDMLDSFYLTERQRRRGPWHQCYPDALSNLSIANIFVSRLESDDCVGSRDDAGILVYRS